MTLPAIVNSARTLTYYSMLQDITANNLANATSDGYKADRMTAQMSAGDPHPLGVQSLDLSQGDLRDTGRSLDVALQGPGFFVVSTKQGNRLSRGGSLQVNSDNVLTDRNGNPVLGTDGPIHVDGNRMVVGTDGTITVDGVVAGKLQIVDVPKPLLLTKQGSGLLIANQDTVEANLSNVGVHQGATEDSNVSALKGSVDMIMIQRAYAASIDAMRTMDGAMSVVTNDLAKV